MRATKKMRASPAFQYAEKVQSGEIKTGEKIQLAVERFYKFIEEAGEKGYTINHDLRVLAINFFHNFLNHTILKWQKSRFY